MGLPHRLLALVACTVALPLLTGEQTKPVDLPQRDPGIHWPKAFDPSVAPVFSHDELLIHADCHRVWTRMIDAMDRPSWFVLTKAVSIDGTDKELAHGTLLHVTIFGSPISTRIDEFEPNSRLSWIPQGADERKPSHDHTWRFIPESSSCRVETEESGIGPNDVKSPEAMSRFMHRAHDLWLASLRYSSEQ